MKATTISAKGLQSQKLGGYFEWAQSLYILNSRWAKPLHVRVVVVPIHGKFSRWKES